MASIQTKMLDEDGVARDAFTRLAAAADEFEGYAHPHAERIAAISTELAKLFGLGRADRASLRIAALAHDLGEVAMRRDYIRRAAPLTFEERLDLARHPVIGEQEAARAGADRGAQLLVRWHQEWWNGTGYPDALAREQIPLAARILRVADAYAALTDARPFRPALTEEEARKHLTEWAGLEFDPRVVRAFLTLRNLPALRSYARRDEEFVPDDAATPQAETTSDAPRSEAEEWNVGGHIPEAGTNPYVQRAVMDAPQEDAILDINQNSGGAQDSGTLANDDQDSDALTKADILDRHA
ncbi:MAG TPA: HD domain-containing phosphohydrolase [Pyrinomonadaceae bacterium]|nr:HD domain-containing phosphohydrolase [Pyrinomonadaceae bacterium]